jgi:SNF2 family DNA or RNA helicase
VAPPLKPAESQIPEICQFSEKLLLVYHLIKSIREKAPADKIILVSNFNQTLDHLNLLAKEMKWGSLRIDGTVNQEKKYKIIQFFNKPPSSSASSGTASANTNHIFLLLLSCKAGGVGLNLIGANHLILMEPDWNPSNDLQAISRIWRNGQKKEVYIYRLFYSQSIEEAILYRQFVKVRLKLELSAVDVAMVDLYFICRVNCRMLSMRTLISK